MLQSLQYATYKCCNSLKLRFIHNDKDNNYSSSIMLKHDTYELVLHELVFHSDHFASFIRTRHLRIA